MKTQEAGRGWLENITRCFFEYKNLVEGITWNKELPNSIRNARNVADLKDQNKAHGSATH